METNDTTQTANYDNLYVQKMMSMYLQNLPSYSQIFTCLFFFLSKDLNLFWSPQSPKFNLCFFIWTVSMHHFTTPGYWVYRKLSFFFVTWNLVYPICSLQQFSDKYIMFLIWRTSTGSSWRVTEQLHCLLKIPMEVNIYLQLVKWSLSVVNYVNKKIQIKVNIYLELVKWSLRVVSKLS